MPSHHFSRLCRNRATPYAFYRQIAAMSRVTGPDCREGPAAARLVAVFGDRSSSAALDVMSTSVARVVFVEQVGEGMNRRLRTLLVVFSAITLLLGIGIPTASARSHSRTRGTGTAGTGRAPAGATISQRGDTHAGTQVRRVRPARRSRPRRTPPRRTPPRRPRRRRRP